MGPAAPREYRLGVIGHGSVARALDQLLDATRGELSERYGVAYRTTLVATRRGGVLVAEGGVRTRGLPAHRSQAGPAPGGTEQFVEHLLAVLADPATPYDVLVELSTASPLDGRPAADYLAAALASGRHVVTANKAPVAWHAGKLARASAATGAQIRYEAALMDCLPVLGIRTTMVPVGGITAFAGVVNSTTNHILTSLAGPGDWASAVDDAQRLGIAEADPSHDIEGHDAATKAAILANLLFALNPPITPAAVARRGIDAIDPDWPARAAAAGNRVRLVARGAAGASGTTGAQVRVQVQPEELPLTDPLARIDGTSMGLQIDSILAGRLELVIPSPGVEQTAYAVLMDLLALARLEP
ncbi:MAG: homoserine dehydrogenase [Candidatus Dormibacteria bacterium]